ncbi:MAG: UvrD-helicase domain-containing protein, partial [Pelagibacteraceae bacterium]
YLIETKKCFGQQILCVTFTNKAANEMRERILHQVSSKSVSFPWLGTFHSICNKILRRHAEAVGLKPSFTIIDTLDQIKLIKDILESENIDIKKNPPKLIGYLIDQWKNKGLLPNEVNVPKDNWSHNNAKKIYKVYQQKLKIINCVDFGDLILHVVTIFKNYEDIKKIYQNSFKYILVDEFQDTNYIQNLWLNLLASESSNICAVGDDDQSIYSWRGAEVKNILDFEKNFKNTKIIKLEQNYRSSKNILNAAVSLIDHNKSRLGKKIWSDLEDGNKIKITSYQDGYNEAIGISDIIENDLLKSYKLNSITILVRAAFQTREFEDRFIKIGLPYRIVGGLKFYDRAEIKDALCYLRLINQTSDDLAFDRIVNVPKRSIGETSLKKIHELARDKNVSLFNASQEILKDNLLKPQASSSLKNFLTNILSWQNLSKKENHIVLLERVLDESGYTTMLVNEKTPESESKLENLKELRNSMKNYNNLTEFLENISLQTSIDQDWNGEKINIMTMHSAKGLEFDCVFLPGWEEGLFPHQKSIDEQGTEGIEEERRLAYVAMTRAKKKLFISFANQRKFFGNKNDNYDWLPNIQSRFIDEIEQEYTEINYNENNQDFYFDDEKIYTPKFKKNNKPDNSLIYEKIKTIKPNKNSTNFTIGESVTHDTFGFGKIIHIEGNKLLVNFKENGEKKVIDKYLKKNANK